VNRLEPFLSAHGLVAVLVIATVEGDLSLVVAGVLAHLGLLPLAGVIVAGAGGNLLGDLAWFAAGRRFRNRIRHTRIYRVAGPRIERLAARLGPWQLLAARVVWGTRNASMVFWGQQGLAIGRFLLVDALGCALAATGFAVLGFLVGQGTDVLLGEVRRAEHWLAVAFVAGVALVYGISRLARRELGD
jgi:membrane protein DedA with SNARE-associated domain